MTECISPASDRVPASLRAEVLDALGRARGERPTPNHWKEP
jgi:hypothetical protein